MRIEGHQSFTFFIENTRQQARTDLAFLTIFDRTSGDLSVHEVRSQGLKTFATVLDSVGFAPMLVDAMPEFDQRQQTQLDG